VGGQVLCNPDIDMYKNTCLIITYNHLAVGQLKLAAEIIDGQDLDFDSTVFRSETPRLPSETRETSTTRNSWRVKYLLALFIAKLRVNCFHSLGPKALIPQ
jgi:hypothetical protein